MYWSDFDGICYFEGMPDGVRSIRPIDVVLNSMVKQNHLLTLDDVKKEMNAQVRSAGGNCVFNFKYGQRSTFWRAILGLDNIHWYGKGVIGMVATTKPPQQHS